MEKQFKPIKVAEIEAKINHLVKSTADTLLEINDSLIASVVYYSVKDGNTQPLQILLSRLTDKTLKGIGGVRTNAIIISLQRFGNVIINQKEQVYKAHYAFNLLPADIETATQTNARLERIKSAGLSQTLVEAWQEKFKFHAYADNTAEGKETLAQQMVQAVLDNPFWINQAVEGKPYNLLTFADEMQRAVSKFYKSLPESDLDAQSRANAVAAVSDIQKALTNLHNIVPAPAQAEAPAPILN